MMIDEVSSKIGPWTVNIGYFGTEENMSQPCVYQWIVLSLKDIHLCVGASQWVEG